MEKKTKAWIVGGSIFVVASLLLYRNRYRFLTKDTSILKIGSPYERIQAMGGIPVSWGTTGNRLAYGQYVFYPNNRAFMSDSQKTVILKKGSYDEKKITWDDKSPSTSLDIIFN